MYPQPLTLSPGNAFSLPVTFRPLENVVYEDQIEFSTNVSTTSASNMWKMYSFDLKSSSLFTIVNRWLGGVECSGYGVGLVINRLHVRLPAVHCRVSNWMGDHLCACKPSRYITDHLGQLSLPYFWGR